MKKTCSKSAPAASVDDYLASRPEGQRIILEKLRAAIKSAAPKADEVISYGIPTYKYYGPLVHFAAHESYCSLIVVNKTVLKTLSSELEPFDVSGTTIHFTVERPIPAVLVKKIVKARMKENEERTG